jgi:tyrosyl-DNA phosphodiesterase-1
VSLNDAVQKQELAFALMASYCIDWPWLYEFFDPATPVIVVAQPDASGNESVKEVLPNWIKTTPFLRNGFGCMHMKVRAACGSSALRRC